MAQISVANINDTINLLGDEEKIMAFFDALETKNVFMDSNGLEDELSQADAVIRNDSSFAYFAGKLEGLRICEDPEYSLPVSFERSFVNEFGFLRGTNFKKKDVCGMDIDKIDMFIEHLNANPSNEAVVNYVEGLLFGRQIQEEYGGTDKCAAA